MLSYLQESALYVGALTQQKSLTNGQSLRIGGSSGLLSDINEGGNQIPILIRSYIFATVIGKIPNSSLQKQSVGHFVTSRLLILNQCGVFSILTRSRIQLRNAKRFVD